MYGSEYALPDSYYDAPPEFDYDVDEDGQCTACGGEGEIWFDIEMPDGRTGENSVTCGCGS